MFENIYEVILKVTRDCNLNCQYCYLGDKKEYAGEQMSFGIFKKLIDRIYFDKHLKDKRGAVPNRLQIVFHGGEPTLLGVAKLEKFIAYARHKLPYVTFSMQTNMLLINPKWIKFFKRHKIDPGISIDGDLKKENKLRLHNYDFGKKLTLLKKHGVRFGTLMVLSSNNINNFSKNLNKFIKKYKVTSVKANFVENMATPELCYPEVTAVQMYENVFLPVMDIFWKQAKIREANICHLIDRYIENLLFREIIVKTFPQVICHAKFCGGGNAIVEVEPDGQVLFCGRWKKANELNLIGELNEQADLFGLSSYSQVLKVQLQKVKALRKIGCDTCFAAGICNYGCLAFAYVKYRGEIRVRPELICDYYKEVFNYFKERLHKLIYVYSIIGKREMIYDEKKVLINISFPLENMAPRKRLPSGLRWHKCRKKTYLSIDNSYLKGLL